jgi:hypothetical protein
MPSSLQKTRQKAPGLQPGDAWRPPLTTNRHCAILPAFDIRSCFESSGAGRWPEARIRTNTRKRNVLFQSALSSTPECVGKPSPDTPCDMCLSQVRSRANYSGTPWMYPGEDSVAAPYALHAVPSVEISRVCVSGRSTALLILPVSTSRLPLESKLRLNRSRLRGAGPSRYSPSTL